MENKKKLIIIILIFVILMCGSAILYNSLGKDVDRQQLVTQDTTSDEMESTKDTIDDETESTKNTTDDETESTKDTTDDETESTEDTTVTNEGSDEPTQDEPADEELMLAPIFTVYDIDGNEVKLSDYIGKPIVINFWASWCGPCKSEMPEFEEKYKAVNRDVQFLMVNMTDGSRETVDIASTFIKEQGYTFPVLYDSDSNAAYLYSVYSLPTTYFIDKDGYIVAYATGAIDGATLQKGIDMILEK